MSLNLQIKIIGLISFFSLAVSAQDYRPASKEFWKEVESAMKDSNFEKILQISQEQIESTKKDSLENAEGWLAAGLALQKLKFYFGSTTLFGDILKNKIGTEV